MHDSDLAYPGEEAGDGSAAASSSAQSLPVLKEGWPVYAILVGSLFLQRFGLDARRFALPLVVIIACGVVFTQLLQRRLVIARGPMVWCALFFLTVLASTALSVLFPPLNTQPSYPSLAYVLLLYGVVVFRWRPTLGVRGTLTLLRSFLSVLAVCGCLQFFLQFVGLGLFSFRNILPERLLIESSYNVVIPLAEGSSVYKSNGFFLLEPSIMSQFAAFGLVVELLYFGSVTRLALFALGLMTTFSGTGLLVLAVAVVAASIWQGGTFLRLGKFLLIAVVLSGVVLVAAPEYAEPITRRVGELGSDKSSGFIRFVSPYIMVSDVFSDPRALLGFGPGSAERFDLDYTYGVNALTKVLVEYGVAGLLCYVGLMVSLVYRAELKTLSVVAMVWFVLGGGYFLAPFAVYTLASIFSWGPGGAEPTDADSSQPEHVDVT